MYKKLKLKKQQRFLATAILFIVVVVGAVTSNVIYKQNIACAGVGDNVSGYAWNESAGWISFNCENTSSCVSVDYGVAIDSATGDFSGYAWSENVGWISFNTADVVGCPSGTCQPNLAGDDTVSGWAKILSEGVNGWISLSGTAPVYGVTYNSSTKELEGFAWNDTKGWISFNHKGCDADENGFSDGGAGCPVAGTAISEYAVSYNTSGTPPSAPTITGPDPSVGDINTNYDFGFVAEMAEDVSPWLRYNVDSGALSRGISSMIYDSTNSKYVAAGNDGSTQVDAVVWESLDGETWNMRFVDNEPLDSQALSSIIYANGKYIVAGGDANGGVFRDAAVWESIDLITWQQRNVDTGHNYINSFFYDSVNNKYIAGGYNDGGASDFDAVIWESPDLMSWTRRDVDTSPERQYVESITYDSVNNKYIATGINYLSGIAVWELVVWESTNLTIDPISWTKHSVDVSNDNQRAYKILVQDGSYLLSGYFQNGGIEYPAVWKSTDLVTWTKYQLDTSMGKLNDLIYSPERGRYFVAGHEGWYDAVVWESPDFVNWIKHEVDTSSGTQKITTIIYNPTNDVFMSGGYSTDDLAVVWKSKLQTNNLHYGIDWNNDGDLLDAVDEWLPLSGYDPSGTQSTSTHQWSSTGTTTFQALAEDDEGNQSGWTSHTIVISDNIPPSAPTITGTTTGLININYDFGFVATDTIIDNTIMSVDLNGNYTSLTMGSDDLPVISYQDENSDLKVVKCGNVDCSAGNIFTVVDTGAYSVFNTAITIGSDSFPVISYFDYTNGDLKVAKCGNTACSAGNTLVDVDTVGLMGIYNDIAIGADGFPIIIYGDNTNWGIKVAKCGNADCSAGNTITLVDLGGFWDVYSSITIGSDNLPIISYYDSINTNLKVLKCGNATCSAGNTITTIDSGGDVGSYTSITTGADGLPVISYLDSTNKNLKVLKCGNATCSAGNTIISVDTSGDIGSHTSITMGIDGFPVISYRDETNDDLKVAKCGNASCSVGNILTSVDVIGNIGLYNAISVGADGLPVISYKDSTNTNLKVVKCGNTTCSSEVDQIHYGIDWNNDGDLLDAVDEWLPSSGYDPSGTQSTSTRYWSSTGTTTFQALAEDDEGNQSGWTSHTIVISDNIPPSVPTITGSTTGLINTDYDFGFVATDLNDQIQYGIDWDGSGGGLTYVDSDNTTGYGVGVWSDGNFIYLADNFDGLRTYSVETNGILTFIDLHKPGIASDRVRRVWGDGNFIYVANVTGGIHSYSVDNNGFLTHIDSDDQGGYAQDLWGDGNYVYLANGTLGLQTYSVDGSGFLTYIDSDDQGDYAWDVWGDGNYIYLANGDGGLHTYSVNGSGFLTHISFNDSGFRAQGVWGDGDFIYLANYFGGLRTYTVDGSGILSQVDFYDSGTDKYFSVWGDGRYLYVGNSDTSSQLDVFSVSNDGYLTHRSALSTGNYNEEAYGGGKYLYVANGGGGLYTYTVDLGIDEWVPIPADTYVPSGTQSTSTPHQWGSMGIYTFQALTEDDGGLLSGWTEHTITIGAGNTAPLATILAPADNSTTTSPITLSGDFFDADGDDFNGFEWRDGNCDSGTLLYSSTTLQSIIPTSPVSQALSDGDHYLYFKVVDSLGATSTCDMHKVFITSTTECSNGSDDADADTLADTLDPGCHTDYDPTNAGSYDPTDNDEGDEPLCSNSVDDDGDGYIDTNDPGCHTNNDLSDTYNRDDNDENTCGTPVGVCDAGETYVLCPSDCPFVWIEF